MRKAYPDLISYAREMRGSMTAAEGTLWKELRRRDYGKWRRQHPMLGYVLDFYCPASRLCVEVDGGIHGTQRQRRRDAVRTTTLTAAGIRVLRFDNHNVLHDLDSVLIHIQSALDSPPYPLPPAGEGGAPPARRLRECHGQKVERMRPIMLCCGFPRFPVDV